MSWNTFDARCIETCSSFDTSTDLKVYVPATNGLSLTNEYRSLLFATGKGASHGAHEVVSPSDLCIFNDRTYS